MPKIIKDGVAYGDGVMVDTALDSTSENPVQNKVITGEINDINASLTDKADKNDLPIIECGTIPTNTSSITFTQPFTETPALFILPFYNDNSNIGHAELYYTNLTKNGFNVASFSATIRHYVAIQTS